MTQPPKSLLNTFVPQTDGSLQYESIELKNIVGGDTDSVMFTLKDVFGPDEDPETVCNVSDEIANIVNDEYQEFVERVFNVPKKRSSIIKTEREVFGDKSLFLTKKRYIIHVINEEGNWKSKPKIKGLEIIKSNNPKPVRDFLEELSFAIMYNENSQKIRRRINDFKKSYFQMGIEEIGEPSNLKVLSKYEKEYEKTGTFKGMSPHVKGALFYNSLCTDQDRKILPGDKVKNVYIQDIRSNCISIPNDAEVLPDFIQDEIQIDYEKMWEKKVKKKIVNYLEGANIGIDIDQIVGQTDTTNIQFD